MPYESYFESNRQRILQESRNLSKAAKEVGRVELQEIALHGAEIVYAAKPRSGNEELVIVREADTALAYVRDQLSHH